MTSHDDDILDFDFVDDDDPRASRRRARRRPRRRATTTCSRAAAARAGPSFGGGARPDAAPAPRRRSSRSRSSSSSCSSSGCRAARATRSGPTTGTYMTEIGDVGTDSAKIGADLADAADDPGPRSRPSSRRSSAGLDRSSRSSTSSAPRTSTRRARCAGAGHAVEALQLRVARHAGAARHVPGDEGRRSRTPPPRASSSRRRRQRLEASDVVWQDLFRAPADEATCRTRASRASPRPPSVFVDERDLYTARSMTAIWQRIHGASTGGTPSGSTAASSPRRSPSSRGHAALDRRPRRRSRSRPISRSRSASRTRGENQEVGVEVTLTIPKGTTPIVKKQTIDLLDLGETKTVTFTDFPELAVRGEDVGAGEREARPGRDEHRRTTRPSTPSSSRSSHGRRARRRDRRVRASRCSRSRRGRDARRRRPPRSSARRRRSSAASSHDIVDFAVSLQGADRRPPPCRRRGRGGAVARRPPRRRRVTNTSVVRYDAYEDTGGQQSASFAFLDCDRTGTVVTAIQGRDYARIYVKELERGTRLGRALARGGGGGRARHGSLTAAATARDLRGCRRLERRRSRWKG